MKQLQKNKRWLIPSIGKPLLTLLIGMMSLTMVKAQISPTGTITALTNTVINTECDLNLCAQINNVLSSNYYFAFDNTFSLKTNRVDLNAGFQSFCSKIATNRSISSGLHTVYLIEYPVLGGSVQNKLDSIQINLLNPIQTATVPYTFNNYTYSNYGVASVGGLNPLESYTVNINIVTSITNEKITLSKTVTNSSSVDFTYTPTHNDMYNLSHQVISQCRDNVATGYTIVDWTSNLNICQSFTKPQPINSLSNVNFCTNDPTLQGNSLNYIYQQLLAGSTNTLFVNFGDGSGNFSTSFLTNSSGNNNTGDNASFSVFNHSYLNSGSYNMKSWIENSSACYIDTFKTSIFVGCASSSFASGTITTVGTPTINSVCDLNQICGVGHSYGPFLNFALDNYTNYLNPSLYGYTDGIDRPFCLWQSSNSTFTSGYHKLYLVAQDGMFFGVYDSLNIYVNTPLAPLSVTSASITGATSGEQLITVSNLNPTETHTLTLDFYAGNNLPAQSYSITTTLGTSAFNYTFNPPHVGIYNLIVSGESSCTQDSFLTDLTINIENDPCNYVNTMASFNGIICSNDTAGLAGLAFGYNLIPNSTLSYMVNWGDGSAIQTSTIVNNQPNGSAITFPSFHHHYLTPGTYTIKNWIVNNVNPICAQDTFIGSITINACGNLQGTVYYDANNNCTQDGSENGIGNIEVKVTQGSNVYYAWTNYLGYYNFYNIGIGAYTIEIGNNSSGYSVICANSQAHGTTVNASSVTTENFALNCSSQFDVATNGISLMHGFYPGGTDAILPHVGLYNAACSFSISGQVKIILDPCIKYDPTSIIATNYGFTNLPDAVILAPTGDTLVWNVSNINNMGGFGYWDYPIAVTTCTNAQVGDTVCITVMVLPTNGDANVSNNNFTRCFAIGVAYDPNFKEVSPKGLGVEGYIPANTPELVYTINFQNTGTAPAHNIYVLDTISNNLDYSTLQVLSSSHPMQTYEIGNKALKFMFANIMLPDSTSDEAHSHGYVTYKIKPKANLAAATKIKNTGYIYFDYNSPIVTNTTLNTIELTAGINELSLNSNVNLYPNPASSQIVLQSKTEIATVRVFDITGKELVNTKVGSTKQYSLNISSFDNGTYLVEITNNNEEKAVKKFVKISE